MDLLHRLQRWYTINCNGDWEHSYGVSITNIDNPGWVVKIDLNNTCVKNAGFDYPVTEKTTTNWISYSIKDGVFEGSGGPENLSEILAYFLDTFLPAYIDPACTLQISLPVNGYENRLWLKAEARMLSETEVEIVSVSTSNQAQAYEWGLDVDLSLFGELATTLSDLKTDYAPGDIVKPQVFQSEDNMLRTFLIAPVKAV
jgi:hypothetical protein